MTELAVLVRSIRHAAALSDIAPPHCPWLPPLPEHVAPVAGCVGLVDVPQQQRRDVLSWVPERRKPGAARRLRQWHDERPGGRPHVGLRRGGSGRATRLCRRRAVVTSGSTRWVEPAALRGRGATARAGAPGSPARSAGRRARPTARRRRPRRTPGGRPRRRWDPGAASTARRTTGRHPLGAARARRQRRCGGRHELRPDGGTPRGRAAGRARSVRGALDLPPRRRERGDRRVGSDRSPSRPPSLDVSSSRRAAARRSSPCRPTCRC